MSAANTKIERKTFELSDEQKGRIDGVLAIQHFMEPPERTDAINAIWADLGRELGFKWTTVDLIGDGAVLTFSAEPEEAMRLGAIPQGVLVVSWRSGDAEHRRTLPLVLDGEGMPAIAMRSIDWPASEDAAPRPPVLAEEVRMGNIVKRTEFAPPGLTMQQGYEARRILGDLASSIGGWNKRNTNDIRPDAITLEIWAEKIAGAMACLVAPMSGKRRDRIIMDDPHATGGAPAGEPIAEHAEKRARAASDADLSKRIDGLGSIASINAAGDIAPGETFTLPADATNWETVGDARTREDHYRQPQSPPTPGQVAKMCERLRQSTDRFTYESNGRAMIGAAEMIEALAAQCARQSREIFEGKAYLDVLSWERDVPSGEFRTLKIKPGPMLGGGDAVLLAERTMSSAGRHRAVLALLESELEMTGESDTADIGKIVDVVAGALNVVTKP